MSDALSACELSAIWKECAGVSTFDFGSGVYVSYYRRVLETLRERGYTQTEHGVTIEMYETWLVDAVARSLR